MRFSFVEQVAQIGFVGQRDAEYLQDLAGAPIEVHVVLNNRNRKISYYRTIDLYPDGILGCAPKLLEPQVLLEPLEKLLYLPFR